MDVIPWADAGVAVVIFTIIVRLILFPLSKKAVVTQLKMKEVEPELNVIKEQYKNDRQTQAMKTMELYKRHGFNPFSSILLVLIQLPILYALYSIFVSSGLPVVNASLLYGFVSIPDVNMNFLGLIDISQKSILLSVIAAIAQYFQLHFSVSSSGSKRAPVAPGQPPRAEDIAHNMTKNLKYIFPVVVFFISYKISAAIALYWAVTNIFTLVQEIVVRRQLNTTRLNQVTTK
jgi:YidC/Oxa1 family membrane protein insertase